MTARARGGRPRRPPRRMVIHRAGGSTVELGHPEPRPLRAVVLNLDAARNTGVAVYIDGRLRAYDECDARDPAARRDVALIAIHAAEVRARPVAVCVEAPWGGYQSAALSLTATVALWRDTWLALQRDPSHFIELTAGQWRRGLFGRASLTREQVRAAEAMNARAIVTRDLPRAARIGADAAAAVCMGSVTSRAHGVRARLGCDLYVPNVTNTKGKAT